MPIIPIAIVLLAVLCALLWVVFPRLERHASEQLGPRQVMAGGVSLGPPSRPAVGKHGSIVAEYDRLAEHEPEKLAERLRGEMPLPARLLAISALANARWDDARLAIVDALQHKSPTIRRVAVGVLSHHRDEVEAQTLLQLHAIHDADPVVRSDAAEILLT